MEAKSEPLMQVPAAVPKAKDPNKREREMSTEERQKLGIGLLSLPPEKNEHMVDILTKRNRNLRDKDELEFYLEDELEVSLEDLDTETLWELDRLVTNYKKIGRVSESDVVPAAASNPKPKAKDPNKREKRRQPMEAKSKPLMQVPAAVPKAKDPNKREMSTEERQKLGIGLLSLPPEKIGHVVDILTKRNRNLRDKDELEVDLEDLDTETLWELNRFVTNYKKIKRVSESDVVPEAASNPKPKA